MTTENAETAWTGTQEGGTSFLRLGIKAPGEASGRIGLALVALGLIVLFSALNAAFFSVDNFVVIGVNSTSILIAVLGTSALLIAGYVDLSIGSMVALIGIIVAKVAVLTGSATLAIIVGLGLGFLLGLVNGVLVRKLSISPLIVTLAMLALYGGLAFVVSSTAVYGFPSALLELGRGKILGVQFTVLIALCVFIIGAFILTSTVIGLRIYAIGGDPRAAELCGIPVGKTVVGLYAVNGLLIGLVAVLIAGRLGSITPTIGVRFELDVLTAAILGGVAFSGGAGRPLGIAIGVATIGILNAGLIFVGLQSWWQSIAVGSMLLLALTADQLAIGMRRKRASAAPHSFSVADTGAAPAPATTRQAKTMDDGGPIFAIDGARKSFGAVTALEEASFTVHKGEIVCLLGDNGAGKSTVVKIISGALQPDAGAMRLQGRPAAFRSPQDARAAGLETVYQDLALCPNLSVAHNMILGREETRRWLGLLPVRDDRKAAEQCRERLAALGVTLRDEDVLVRSLSGGQRQSIAIARSLGAHVKLICLDEPTAALGVKQTAQVINLIRSIAAQGTGVILVTHDLATVRALADRIVVLSLGRVAYDGPVRDLSADQLWSLMARGTLS
ncbi:ATP-binding cassette domain-containing protein [Nordella sp. HKS 07]|uniref:ATP-binding cassette domain-containing protein n=1 Tax=Nordella sp. HKS 07 TaxID=2712222 RepID=UPI0013E10C7F|nr:ATP-binding cassette domain-containing protein [Nordella sp. HKS 07]QIG51697.1 ATP-binding cassette domain-containing protein [Nordella sp. HKS 07]